MAPDLVQGHNNLGRALEALNRHEAAVESYARAAALAPDYAGAQWNLALARLALGDFAAGWAGYEWRWRNGDLCERRFAEPPWRGEPLAGRTILVHAEQGLGDTVHFARYVPLLAARGARVMLEVQRPLLRLLASLAGIERLYVAVDPLPARDCHVPLLSLPGLFATTLETIPADVPYLGAASERVAKWAALMAPMAAPCIGFAWAGSATNRNDRNRSMPLEALLPLFEIAGPSFFSLQKEMRPGEAEMLARFPEVHALGDRLEDFADTAAAMAQLDVVISVDTAAAHLAGALARPLWLLLPFAAEWRWLRQRETSPWYPTARPFRQPQPGDWAGVVGSVRSEIEALAAAA